MFSGETTTTPELFDLTSTSSTTTTTTTTTTTFITFITTTPELISNTDSTMFSGETITTHKTISHTSATTTTLSDETSAKSPNITGTFAIITPGTSTTRPQETLFLYNVAISIKIKNLSFTSDYNNLSSSASIKLQNEYFSLVSEI